MPKTIVPASLEFKDGVPYSAAYGDIYHSADGGAGQARHVFLQGCDLPGKWAGRENFIILETGFGTGLNFLATWEAWRADPARPARLHFFSVEKHPFRSGDLARLHGQWPEFAALSSELLANWPMLTPGFHRIALDGGRVQLTLMLGDALDCLPQLQAGVDAFYLDGFAPDCNADLWQASLFDELVRLAKPAAVAATYTVAAAVREGLGRAGFICEKRAGYGRKRHCLSARFAGESAWKASAVPRHVAVIGAGVAGAAVAHALAQRDVSVTVLERSADIGLGASGNPVAVFRPVISRDDNRPTRLTRAAFLHDLRAWTVLADGNTRPDQVEWSRCGVLHLARDAATAQKQKTALDSSRLPADFARWVEAPEAGALANWKVGQPGVYYPDAGWIAPAGLCRAWLHHPRIATRYGCTVARIEATGNQWDLHSGDGTLLLRADAVVLANARDALALVPEQPWPLQTVRGQITRLPEGALAEIGRVIAREGYLSPTPDRRTIVGATYEHDSCDTRPRRESDEANLARLEAILPGAAANIDIEAVEGRASLRAVLPDRLPLLGPVKGREGVHVAAGYGSRGVVWAALLGETLTCQILQEPLPLERDLIEAISPARYGVPK